MAEFEEKLNAILSNESAMGQIMALAQSFSNSGEEAQTAPQKQTETEEVSPAPMGNPLSMLGDMDPRMVQLGMRLLGEYQGENSQSMALLSAIRPYIRPERYEKLDKAMQLAKLSRVVRVLFQTLGEGAEDV